MSKEKIGSVINGVEQWTDNNLSGKWKVDYFYPGGVIMSMRDTRGEKVFGSEVDFRLDDGFLTANVGSAGRFRVSDLTDGSRSMFYSDLGKMLDSAHFGLIVMQGIEINERS